MPSRLVDLSMTIEEGMQTFPTHWHPFVEISQLGRHGIEDRETRKLVLGTHTGTHIDAPRHFIPGGMSVDELALETMTGPATVADLTHVEPSSAVSAADLAATIGDRPRERVLLRFDWDRHLGTLRYYRDLPFLSPEAASWLVNEGCRLLGMDTPMADDPANGRGSPNDSPIHKILLGSNIVLVEYMINLSELTAPIVDLVVAPLKVRGGDGAPARAFAWVEDVRE